MRREMGSCFCGSVMHGPHRAAAVGDERSPVSELFNSGIRRYVGRVVVEAVTSRCTTLLFIHRLPRGIQVCCSKTTVWPGGLSGSSAHATRAKRVGRRCVGPFDNYSGYRRRRQNIAEQPVKADSRVSLRGSPSDYLTELADLRDFVRKIVCRNNQMYSRHA